MNPRPAPPSNGAPGEKVGAKRKLSPRRITINLVIDIDREGVAHYYICAVSIKIISK